MRIGLVEDNCQVLDYLTYALETVQGHTISSHLTGASLLQQLFLERDENDPLPYDLLILDLQLPGSISGLAVLAYLHQTSLLSRLPIIVCSAASPQQLRDLVKQYPAVQTIHKPFKLGDIFKLIKKVQPR